MCGLDGDFSWAPLGDWPKQAERAARLTLQLWGGDDTTDLIRSQQEASDSWLLAFRLPMREVVSGRGPWVIVRHPLWRWGLDKGPLAAFAAELGEANPDQAVLCWDTFNLTRRPGRSRQWMTAQGARRRKRRRR